ncbi:MAG: hypothetical protein V4731_15025 [Pseudomonadota bacterium]
MTYQVLGDDGGALDAHLDVDGPNIVFHSRGGASGKNARNVHYAKALRLLVERLAAAEILIEGAWVDSSRVQAIQLSDRAILGEADAGATPAVLVARMSSRMQAIGKDPASKSDHGNSTKRILLTVTSTITPQELLAVLKVAPSKGDFKSQERLPASELKKATDVHFFLAVQKLCEGFKDHEFADSDAFDVLLEDGTRLPPKAVFGIALADALGFQVLPKHFSGGLGTVCFERLGAAGYAIVPKDGNTPEAAEPKASPDSEWAEGNPKLRSHLKRERAPSLSKAKKADFRNQNAGKLFCEKCKVDPVAHYGSEDGEACIEVHHHLTQVAEMVPGHKTKLADLMCLCANCHRLEHRLLRNLAAAGN